MACVVMARSFWYPFGRPRLTSSQPIDPYSISARQGCREPAGRAGWGRSAGPLSGRLGDGPAIAAGDSLTLTTAFFGAGDRAFLAGRVPTGHASRPFAARSRSRRRAAIRWPSSATVWPSRSRRSRRGRRHLCRDNSTICRPPDDWPCWRSRRPFSRRGISRRGRSRATGEGIAGGGVFRIKLLGLHAVGQGLLVLAQAGVSPAAGE